MVKIENYEFGKIVINGNTYESDLIVFPDRVFSNWWRKEGHSLNLEDLKEVFKFKDVEVIVIGTGFHGIMQVPLKLKEKILEKGIEVIIQKTSSAYQTFNNKILERKKVVGCFHLTC